MWLDYISGKSTDRVALMHEMQPCVGEAWRRLITPNEFVAITDYPGVWTGQLQSLGTAAASQPSEPPTSAPQPRHQAGQDWATARLGSATSDSSFSLPLANWRLGAGPEGEPSCMRLCRRFLLSCTYCCL